MKVFILLGLLLFVGALHTVDAALPRYSEAELKKNADLIVIGKVIEVKTERKTSGEPSKPVVKDSYTITISVQTLEKAPEDLAESKTLVILGYDMVKMPYPGPSGHLNITRLDKDTLFKAHCRIGSTGKITIIDPNGLSLLPDPEVKKE